MLSTLLQGVVIDKLVGDLAVQVQAISFDSRIIVPSTLFVATQGTKKNGHTYIQQATGAGATVVVCEYLPNELAKNVTYVLVSDSAKALGIIASNFYGNPSAQLQLVAVTGTNGKTSTVQLLSGLFNGLGYRVGMLSTICNQVNTEKIAATHTTPDAIQINALLARMVAAGCQYCFMEASSHSIAQKRIAGLQFRGAIFLNITHDHLDYHLTFEAYIRAKKMLFDNLPASAFALYNLDDKRSSVMIQNTRAACYSFAIKTPATFTAKPLSSTWQGLELRIAHQTVWFRLVGNFNAYNLLAAYATACLLGEDNLEVLTTLSTLTPVCGRFQHLHTPAGFDTIIDYAHTPDALKNVLTTIQQLKSRASKVITVVGCGGERDRQKRPLMAQIAWRLSDYVIFTTDNPRTEAPQAIIQDMKAGLAPTQQQQTLVIIDRAEAIKAACQLAKPNDVVLIAGKGHENYQEIGGKRYLFNDQKVLESMLKRDIACSSNLL